MGSGDGRSEGQPERAAVMDVGKRSRGGSVMDVRKAQQNWAAVMKVRKARWRGEDANVHRAS